MAAAEAALPQGGDSDILLRHYTAMNQQWQTLFGNMGDAQRTIQADGGCGCSVARGERFGNVTAIFATGRCTIRGRNAEARQICQWHLHTNTSISKYML